jgi:hypothetical protein
MRSSSPALVKLIWRAVASKTRKAFNGNWRDSFMDKFSLFTTCDISLVFERKQRHFHLIQQFSL